MKWPRALVLLAALGGGACEDDEARYRARPKGPKPVEVPSQAVLPVSPRAPLHLAKPDEARVRIELSGAREAVRGYRMEHGRPPPSLGALHLNLRFGADLAYDPRTGRVKSRSYPQY